MLYQERLGDFLCDAFIQNAEGKGLGDGHILDVQRCPRAPQKAGERRGDDLMRNTGGKSSWAFRHAVLIGAP